MEADFTVLESELSLIQSGDRVFISPYSDAASRYEGVVTQINPLVDEKGMVKVKASVNGKGRLFSGMNVRVNVFRSLDKQFVIPKSAVVLRSGRQVVYLEEWAGQVELCPNGIGECRGIYLGGGHLKPMRLRKATRLL